MLINMPNLFNGTSFLVPFALYCAEKVIDLDIFFIESSPEVDDKVKLVHFSSPSERGVGQQKGEGGKTS